MGGGLMQLVAYGAQDIYLTGNPQITFFKVVYRRHTNFSMECIEQTFNGTVAATASTVTATISRNGDLISNMHLDVKFAAGMTGADNNASTQWTNNTGHAFVKEVEIEIGGQRIDKHYGQFLDIYNELTDHNESDVAGLNKHKAKNAYLLNGASGTGAMDTLRTYVPLKFWFNRNPGLALPLIALQYHEVKVKLSTRSMIGLVNTTGTLASTSVAAPSECKLWVDYIYLDTDERRRFAQQSHEYLIEQLQREEATMSKSQRLNFNHPVKELIWVVQDDTARSENSAASATDIDATLNVTTTTIAEQNDYFNYNTNITNDSEVVNGQTSYESFATAKLQLNGHDRFAARNASYFRTVHPAQAGHRVPEKHIYNYSFALKPEEHQPSGTCNFSRIDTAKLIFTTGGTLSGTTLTVYAVNYNVLRIMSGMGGLAYSN
jgi:hypothetical protein